MFRTSWIWWCHNLIYTLFSAFCYIQCYFLIFLPQLVCGFYFIHISQSITFIFILIWTRGDSKSWKSWRWKGGEEKKEVKVEDSSSTNNLDKLDSNMPNQINESALFGSFIFSLISLYLYLFLSPPFLPPPSTFSSYLINYLGDLETWIIFLGAYLACFPTGGL